MNTLLILFNVSLTIMALFAMKIGYKQGYEEGSKDGYYEGYNFSKQNSLYSVNREEWKKAIKEGLREKE